MDPITLLHERSTLSTTNLYRPRSAQPFPLARIHHPFPTSGPSFHDPSAAKNNCGKRLPIALYFTPPDRRRTVGPDGFPASEVLKSEVKP
jgi:hypothetical protein